MSNEKLYFVSYLAPSSKVEFLPVWVTRTSGADIQAKNDIEEARASAISAGKEPKDVFTAESLLSAFDLAAADSSNADQTIQHFFDVFSDRSAAEEEASRREAEFHQSIDKHTNEISDSIARFASVVLPVNTVAYFCLYAGITRPSFSRVIAPGSASGGQRGVSWPIMARVLESMGILGEVSSLIQRRVNLLHGSRKAYVASQGIVEYKAKTRNTG